MAFLTHLGPALRSMTLVDYDVLEAHFCGSGGAGWPCILSRSSLSFLHKGIWLRQEVSSPFL